MVNSCVIEFAVIINRSLFGLFESADLVTEIRFNFDLAGRKVSLEIFLIVVGIPEAPFYIRKYLEFLFLIGSVLNIKKNDFAGVTHGNEVQLTDRNAVL